MHFDILYIHQNKKRGDFMVNKGRTTQRLFKLTKEEDAQLQKDAHSHEMNISEYLRWLIEKERKRMKKRGN